MTVVRTGTRRGSTSRSVVAAPERGRGRVHGTRSRCLVKGLGVEVVGASGRGRGRGPTAAWRRDEEEDGGVAVSVVQPRVVVVVMLA